jgi:hypothetical protein
MSVEGTPGRYTVQRFRQDGRYVGGEGVATMAEAQRLKEQYEQAGYRVEIIEGKPPDTGR